MEMRERLNRQRQMAKWMNGWMDGLKDRRTDGWTE
jgi:hypothetical protein